MDKSRSTPKYIKDGILFSIAIFIAVMIYLIDVSVPPSLAFGSIYCLVILYSWILPGKNVSIYIGIFCTVLIIAGIINKPGSIPQGSLEGFNTFIAIIAVWICVTLVSAAKSGYNGMEKVLSSLETKVKERTYALSESRKELEVSEKVYRYLYEHSNEMHASVCFEHFNITRCNETLCDKLGYTKQELLEQPIEILHDPSCTELLERSLSEFKETEILKNTELLLKTKSGDKIVVILNITAVKDNQGNCTLGRFSWTDISELKKLELERIANAERLKMQNKELEQFVFIASHDLQEPLRTITSFSEILSNEYYEKFDRTAKDSIDFILEATARMRNLVKGLLDYSRLGKDAEKQQIDIGQIITDLKKDLSLKISETNTVIEYSNMPAHVMGYKGELNQLFLNLIVNAMKFKAKNRDSKVNISWTKSETDFVFCVEDNGIGISEEHTDKIFKMFKRMHNRQEYEGTGIGLAHCQKIVDLHGGKIWVDSKLGEGSKFYFTIKI